MTKIDILIEQFLGPLAIVAVITAFLFGLNALLLKYQPAASRRTLRRQVIMLAVTLIAFFSLILLMPMKDDNLRYEILRLVGILASAAIALSSTTFLGNILAGILLRSVRSFHTGDIIYINDQFGRVSDRGLFHIEIQTEDSDLVTLPNLYVTNNPVKVTRKSGTIVSSEVSLGYDVSRNRVEDLLIDAATGAGLTDPFVYILKLGDFSILYRVNGMLPDVKQLLTARSRLNASILDSLHGAAIEIVSPNFMNTRDVAGMTFTSRPVAKQVDTTDAPEPDDIIFEKAEQAATLEELKASVDDILTKLKTLKEEAARSESDEKTRLIDMIERLQKQHARLDQQIEDSEKEIDQENSKE
jgi:small-conductance mechanosensitive channel